MPGDFDLVKERVDIVQLIGESVPLKKAGRGYVGLCPFHNEKSPSFHVDPERRTYKCFGCLPPGSLIKTGDGPRPIESIRPGEGVYARDGRLHPVLEIHEHLFAGELVKITCAPFKIPVLLTPDHKVPVIRPRSRRVEEVPAGQIRAQNYLLYPLIERPVEVLDWAALPVWFGKRGKHPKALPTEVDVSSFAEWLGWYLAEGSVSNDRSVRFSLGGDEGDVAQRLSDLSQHLFNETPRIDLRKTKIEMWFCHALLSRWLKHNCGDGARNKRLPDFVWTWPRDAQQRLLDALILGDGRRNAGGHVARFGFLAKPSWSLGLASVRLIDDVRDLLLRMGVVPGMTHRTESNGHESWRLAVSEGGQQRWGAGERPPLEALPVRVRKVERVEYDGPVHNLTVEEEHTYLTLSGAVCNCGEGGDIFTWLEKQRGLSPAEALKELAERAGVELTRRAPEERKLEDRLLAANDAAAFYFRQALRG
ncbi:MAG: CHC2 zinc finger domain-containing protein, partial [Chloroflexota bacterium]|nr:CHC2 zinc finger domain-containing protein [Chloroflexota bacterium]